MGSEALKVAIVEDLEPLRTGLAQLIGASPGFARAEAFGSVEDALDAMPGPADVLLLDIELPGMSGVEAVPRLLERFPGMAIVMLTVFADDAHVFEAICRGAAGYLLKDTSPARLLEAIREAHAGGAPMSPEIARKVVEAFRRTPPPAASPARLSPRETELLRLLADGHSYKTAAAELAISEDTVRFHIRHVYEKLHVHSTSEAVAKALRGGLI